MKFDKQNREGFRRVVTVDFLGFIYDLYEHYLFRKEKKLKTFQKMKELKYH